MSSKTPSRPHPSGDLQHQAEHTIPRKTPSILVYLVILFIVAFLLLFIAYFQQQRINNEATDDARKQSASALQSIQDLLSENEKLREEVTGLEAQVDALGKEKASLDISVQNWADEADLAQRQLAAMDYFWRIQRFYSRGSRRSALELVQEFEASGLTQDLPRTNPAGIEGTSPADQYQALLDALDYRPDP